MGVYKGTVESVLTHVFEYVLVVTVRVEDFVELEMGFLVLRSGMGSLGSVVIGMFFVELEDDLFVGFDAFPDAGLVGGELGFE